MRLTFQLEDRVSAEIRRLARTDLARFRGEAVDDAMRAALGDVIQFNPVDTARSRAAWAASLEQLGGAPPAGWQGAAPTGAAEGRELASLSRTHDADITDIAAENAVGYVPFLEYGTRRTAPVGMVRRALGRVRQTLIDRFRAWLR